MSQPTPFCVSSNNAHYSSLQLCIILLFYFTILGFGNYLTNIVFSTDEMTFYGRALVRVVTFSLLVLLSIKHLQLNASELREMIGNSEYKKILLAVSLGVVLFLFFIGYEGFEVWFLSEICSHPSYSTIIFTPNASLNLSTPDLKFFTSLLIATVAAPMAEEFFFRGLLLPSLAKKHAIHKGATLSSAVFVLAHGQNPYFIHTFIFSLCLSYLYLTHHSLGICIITHAAYNFTALNSEFFLSEWIIHNSNMTDVSSTTHIQLIIFAISASILAYGFIRCRSLMAEEIRNINKQAQGRHAK